MLIKDFAEIGNIVGEIHILRKNGYLWARINKDKWDIDCSTSRFEIRKWKSIDVLIKHMVEKGFEGKFIIDMNSGDQNENDCK